MPRAKKTLEQLEAEPLEKKSRRKKQAESPAGLPVAELREAIPSLVTAAELSPPEREIVEPTPEATRPRDTPAKNGTEYPSFQDKIAQQRSELRPSRKDPNASFNVLNSQDARIDKDGQVFEVTLADKPDAAQYAQMQRWGFDDATEHNTGEQWTGYRQELLKQSTDINHVAMVLAGKGDGRGR